MAFRHTLGCNTILRDCTLRGAISSLNTRYRVISCVYPGVATSCGPFHVCGGSLLGSFTGDYIVMEEETGHESTFGSFFGGCLMGDGGSCAPRGVKRLGGSCSLFVSKDSRI